MNNTHTMVGGINQGLRNSTDGRPLSHEVIAGSAAAVQQLNVPAEAKAALIQFEASNIAAWTDTTKIARAWFDSKTTAVSTTSGMAMSNLAIVEINNLTSLREFRFILTEAQTAKINVQYFK
jgi:hypothetical protein